MAQINPSWNPAEVAREFDWISSMRVFISILISINFAWCSIDQLKCAAISQGTFAKLYWIGKCKEWSISISTEWLLRYALTTYISKIWPKPGVPNSSPQQLSPPAFLVFLAVDQLMSLIAKRLPMSKSDCKKSIVKGNNNKQQIRWSWIYSTSQSMRMDRVYSDFLRPAHLCKEE